MTTSKPTSDPCSRSVAGDSGHGMMAVTPEDIPVNSHEELAGAVGGMDENVSTENLSDVELKEDNPLIKINDEMSPYLKHQMPL